MTAHTLTIALDDPLAAEVRLAAQARGLTLDEYVRTSLKEDLEFQADRNEIESRTTRFLETGLAVDPTQVLDTLRRRSSVESPQG